MNIYKYLRKLAKSVQAQNIFTAAKDMGNIRLFNNDTDFSRLQQEYLSYLYMYNNIFQEIYSKEVSPKVLDNDIFTDAYLYYKSKKSKDKSDKKSIGKKRKLSAVFSKTNKIKFPNQKEVN